MFRCFNSDMSITVRSAYGAEEGDNVSICYTDSLWATAARRENLVYSKVRTRVRLSDVTLTINIGRTSSAPAIDVKMKQRTRHT